LKILRKSGELGPIFDKNPFYVLKSYFTGWKNEKICKKKTKGDNIVREPIGNILDTRWKQFF
jgi:hypothetical protein